MALGPFSPLVAVIIATIAEAFAVVALFNQVLNDLARSVLAFYGGMAFTGLFQTPGLLALALLGRRWTAFATQNPVRPDPDRARQSGRVRGSPGSRSPKHGQRQ